MNDLRSTRLPEVARRRHASVIDGGHGMSTSVQATIKELREATRILVGEGIIDGFGHVSARHPEQPDRYFMLLGNVDEPTADDRVMELDADSNPVGASNARPSIERFIHGEIYRQRPDVLAVVHTHAPPLIPFGVSDAPLRPLYHMCGFLEDGVPVFDIRKEHGVTNMLITSHVLGQSLTASLGPRAMVLMRGHGATVVGGSLKEAVFRSVYATINAQLQPIAMQLGQPTFLDPGEATLTDQLHRAVVYRPWEYWLKKHDLKSR
jgi:ribulose-5-phosphate 4-epimerase/fuculose-1-phosphate aldolase